jgi:hypothetical protein
MHNAKKDNFSSKDRYGQINQIREGCRESSILAPTVGIPHVVTEFPPSIDTGNVWRGVVASAPAGDYAVDHEGPRPC